MLYLIEQTKQKKHVNAKIKQQACEANFEVNYFVLNYFK